MTFFYIFKAIFQSIFLDEVRRPNKFNFELSNPHTKQYKILEFYVKTNIVNFTRTKLLCNVFQK
jgi:hypothetical protein